MHTTSVHYINYIITYPSLGFWMGMGMGMRSGIGLGHWEFGIHNIVCTIIQCMEG
jgi:hypothetical protein